MRNGRIAHIPAYLVSTYKMMECAFPDGIANDKYLPLLVVLQEKLSHRNLAEVVSIFLQEDKVIVMNDLYRAMSVDIPTSESIKTIKQYLLPCGYQNWLAED